MHNVRKIKQFFLIFFAGGGCAPPQSLLAPAALVFTLSYTLFSTFRRVCMYYIISTGFFFSEPWCGLMSACPVLEGTDVTIGCYARYRWLATLLQYNPLVTITASVEFMQAPGTKFAHNPTSPNRPPPQAEHMMTTHTIRNVRAGDELEYTCKIQYTFIDPGYSPRNGYANNSLAWSRCTVKETVSCKYMCLIVFNKPVNNKL